MTNGMNIYRFGSVVFLFRSVCVCGYWSVVSSSGNIVAGICVILSSIGIVSVMGEKERKTQDIVVANELYHMFLLKNMADIY